MEIDLSKLNADQLDELISKAAAVRANIKPEHPKDPPASSSAIHDPAWYTALTEDKLVALLIRHPGLGWLSFALPPHEMKNMFSLWSKMLSVLNSENIPPDNRH